ncbi:Uncharacterised protein [uncultured archaeon]|nr:Uncharacterised protein [uncultured archaeon]
MNLVNKVLATAGLGLALSLNGCSDLKDKKYETLFMKLNVNGEMSVGYCDDNSKWENERYNYKLIFGGGEAEGVIVGGGLLVSAQRDKNHDHCFGLDEFITPEDKYKIVFFRSYQDRLILGLDIDNDGKEEVRYYYLERGEVDMEMLQKGILAGTFELSAIQVDKNKNGEFEKDEFILDNLGLNNGFIPKIEEEKPLPQKPSYEIRI